MANPFASFDPVVRDWFLEHVGEPAPVQRDAWNAIASREHVLAIAPTGSGKTLAAFLWSLNQLLTGAWSPGATRVVYVSPLKALNNDVHRNVEAPLDGLAEAFKAAGKTPPTIRVFTRSGDTPPQDRERMLRHPPEILITTPESLNLLLTSKRARTNLDAVEQVILDEIHAVAGTKRGTHLITAVDRLVPLSGEFQRIALSATVRPASAVAEFVGGYTVDDTGPEPVYTKRPVRIVEAKQAKRYAVRVETSRDDPHSNENSVWTALVQKFRDRINNNRATLLFVNSRRLCERITSLLNENQPNVIAYPHHGSLSRELRLLVEEKLKHGELKAIVATSSLELGIDVGDLDEVLMVQSPFNVVSALQRVGRAGHQVDAESRGIIYPTHGRDVIEAAVMARCIVEQDIEPIQPVHGALDVLAQVLASMTVVQTWNLDALYRFIRTSAPYRELSRTQFDLVIGMLTGRYRDHRIRALEPMATIDSEKNTIAARDRARPLLSMNGGTIPDRGLYTLRTETGGVKLGELDEEFVWERSIGHVMAFGNRTWVIRAITDNEVLVHPTNRSVADVPFWKADTTDGSHHFADRVAAFLEYANTHLKDPTFRDELQRSYFMDPAAADALIEFLKRQRGATESPLPHRHHIVAEHFEDERDDSDTRQIIFHTNWGGTLNRPFAYALSQAYDERYGTPLEVYSNNDSVVAVLPHDCPARELIGLVKPGALESLLRKRLERTGFFGAKFRENAGRALLLPRRGFDKRMPLWMNRLRARKLLETVAKHNDFPILLETWRTCFHDLFELGQLAERLAEIASGQTAVTDCTTTTPSPFAAGVVWRQTNKHMYAEDAPLEGGPSKLDDRLVHEAVHAAALRPAIPRPIAETFQAKLQRSHPGYAPETAGELAHWVHERRFIPAAEWDALLAAIEGESGAVASEAAQRLVRVVSGDAFFGVVSREDLGVSASLWPNANFEGCEPLKLDVPPDAQPLSEWLSDWLRFYGPIPRTSMIQKLPPTVGGVEEALDTLIADRTLVEDAFLENATETQICDAENLERLLRIVRRSRRTVDALIPADELPARLAMRQGIAGSQSLEAAIERLLGYPIPAGVLEHSILPARVSDYKPEDLDELLGTTGAMWFGCGNERIAIGLRDAMELFADPTQPEQVSLIEDAAARYTFSGLLDKTGLDSTLLALRLWEAVWAGEVSNDSFEAVRKGLANRFRPPKLPDTRKGLTRGARHRWKLGRPEAGHWFAIPRPDEPADAMEREELAMERARLLLERYGVVFRSLLAKESAPFRWSAVFPALRRMELAGEILAGVFVHGVSELQFAVQDFVEHAVESIPSQKVFWMNATDPASLCGISLEGIGGELPRRVPGVTLVYRGKELVIVSERKGASLRINLQPGDAALVDCFGFLRHLRARRSRLLIQTINDEPAPASPYLADLAELFELDRGTRDVIVMGTKPYSTSKSNV